MHKTDHQDILKYILLNFGERKMLRYRTYQRLDVGGGRAAAMAGKRLKTFRQFIVFWWRTIVERASDSCFRIGLLVISMMALLLYCCSDRRRRRRLRERDTEVVKINLWRWQQQLSLRRHLHLHGLVGELVVNGDELVAYRKWRSTTWKTIS